MRYIPILLLLAFGSVSCEQVQNYMAEQARKETEERLNAELEQKKAEAEQRKQESDPLIIEQNLQDRLNSMNMDDPLKRSAAKKMVLQHNQEKLKRLQETEQEESTETKQQEEYSRSVDDWMQRIK